MNQPATERLRLAGLEETRRSFPEDFPPNRVTFTLAITILKRLLGEDWLHANVLQDADFSRPNGFFRIEFSSDERREFKTARVLDFAETLFNLQRVEGFDDRVAQMRTADPEATFAEFDFGKFLYVHGIDFRFVIPTGTRGQDYDYSLRYADGRTACADAKCRVEESQIRPESIRHALETARKRNLPKDEPGIVFVKVPQAWIEQTNVLGEVTAVVRDFLRQTQRMVLVVLYSPLFILRNDQKMMWMRHLFHEIENQVHRFDCGKSWLLFRDVIALPEWQGMPPFWQRIFSKGSVNGVSDVRDLFGLDDAHRRLESALRAEALPGADPSE